MNIIGYSFGAILGSKLGEIFQRREKNIKFISIDGSLSLLNKYLISSFKHTEISYENLENWLIHLICYNILPNSSKADINSILWKENGGSKEKLLKILDLSGNETYSKDFLIKSFYGMLNRIKAMTETSNVYKLNSDIVLIRSNVSFINDIAEDYDLKLITKGKIVLHYSDKNHLTLLEDNKVIDIIVNECKNY